MILFNTTFIVTKSADSDFRNWITTVYIPAISTCPSFSDILFTKILSNPDEKEQSQSYALQFKAPSITYIEEWISTNGMEKLNALQAKHGENALFFATFMDIMHQ